MNDKFFFNGKYNTVFHGPMRTYVFDLECTLPLWNKVPSGVENKIKLYGKSGMGAYMVLSDLSSFFRNRRQSIARR